MSGGGAGGLFNGLSLGLARKAFTGGIIILSSATRLAFAQATGDVIEVEEELVPIPGAGLPLDNTDNVLAADGTDSGAAMAAFTTYYIYCSSSRPAYAPRSVRASATAPSRVNGELYLGAAGDALAWRFIGLCNTVGASQFRDSLTQRLVCNFFNRVPKPMQVTPAYVDNNLQTVYVENTPVWAQMNGGVASQLDYVANGLDSAWFRLDWSVAVIGAAACGMGIASNSATSPTTAAVITALAADESGSLGYSEAPAMGLRNIRALVMTGGVASTFIADFVRNGATADPLGTTLRGWVMQ